MGTLAKHLEASSSDRAIPVNSNKRPLSVTVLGLVYIAVGIAGFAVNFGGLMSFQNDAVWAELTELAAVICGAFMLRGHNWARWAALAWMAFHVILSAFHAWPEFAIHCMFCAVIAWLLFSAEGERYFRGGGSESI